MTLTGECVNVSRIHAAIEIYYRSLKNHGGVEPLEKICERFETCLELDLEHNDVPVIFKKDLSDHKGAVEMGNAMLKVFHEYIAQIVQSVQEIVAFELPLTATLYTDDGQPTPFKLAGILDLVLRDESGEILVVDNKTAARPVAQSTANDSDQMTAYAKELLFGSDVENPPEKLLKYLSSVYRNRA